MSSIVAAFARKPRPKRKKGPEEGRKKGRQVCPAAEQKKRKIHPTKTYSEHIILGKM